MRRTEAPLRPSYESSVFINCPFDPEYKTIFNALPLSNRISSFAPDDVACPLCMARRQTLHHFIYGCPYARQIWREFALYMNLSEPVSLQHALFSWPSSSSSVLGSAYGYRLQAGHAVALHTLWFVQCRARYSGQGTPLTVLSRLFHARLQRHFRTLLASPRWCSRLGSVPAVLYK